MALMRQVLAGLFCFLFIAACGGEEETKILPQNVVTSDVLSHGFESVGLHPLDEILTNDGTIDFSRSIDGSFDPNGFRMILGPDGAPIFKPHLGQGLNDHWVSMNDDVAGAFTVYAVAVLDGNVYVGGDFTTIDGVAANYIARWNGTAWNALGSGVNATVYALAVRGTDLYVGGTFTQAGGASARRVARWDGAAWYPLGVSAGNANGTSNAVFALAVSGTNVYVGGQFTTVRQSDGTDINAGRIARWDTATSTWSRLGGTAANNGFNNIVRALAVSEATLYAGGQFTAVRDNTGTNITVNRIAQ